MIGFASPWLLLLLAMPLLALRLLPPVALTGGALVVPRSLSSRLKRSAASAAARRNWILPSLLWLALVTALAGPRIVVPSLASPVSGREIVLALDLSGSMSIPDFTLNGQQAKRIDAVKQVASDFIRGRQGDRLSLILFGSDAYFATPQTYDVEAIAHAIGDATIGISGRATGISNALGLALKRLRTVNATSKVVVLLSDGVNNTGPVKPRDAARLAKETGVRVHTIALGPEVDMTDRGKSQRGAVDVETLRAIARISGGTAFQVKTTDDLIAVTREIDALESDDRTGPPAELYRDLWAWPGTLAFLFALAIAVRRPG